MAAQSLTPAARRGRPERLAGELPSTVTDTHSNIAATARHLARHMGGSPFGTSPELFPRALAQPISPNMR
ncbi:hypothetical protein GCM10018954_043820 [Kutzneria kofuensis]